MNPGDFEFERFRKPPLHNARLPAAAKTVLFVGWRSSKPSEPMSEDEFIPRSYASWRHCITVKCQILLTREDIADRLVASNYKREPHTEQFLRLYGDAYRRLVIEWFERAEQEPRAEAPAA